MDKTRSSGRARAMLGASIIFNNRNSTIDCKVRNISVRGARIELAESMAVPQEFELFVPHKGRAYRARMCWRNSESIGVEFFDEAAAAVAVPAPPPADRAPGRVADLETENAALRLRVAELTELLESARRDRSERAA